MNPEETRDFESEINECIKEPEFDISKRSEQEGLWYRHFIKENDLEMCKWIYENRANESLLKFNLKFFNYYSESLLTIASDVNNLEILKWIYSKEYNSPQLFYNLYNMIFKFDCEVYLTVMHNAAINNNIDMINWLIYIQSVDEVLRSKNNLVHFFNCSGKSPLYKAITRCNVEASIILILNGALDRNLNLYEKEMEMYNKHCAFECYKKYKILCHDFYLEIGEGEYYLGEKHNQALQLVIKEIRKISFQGKGKLALAIFKKAHWSENNYDGLIDTISDFVFDKKYTQKMTENAITFIKLIDIIINERISCWLNYMQ